MAGSLRDYTDLTTAVKDWIDDIAPKYFNFDQVANYRTGIFGYINEVMGTVTEDVFNAVSVARREFYPTHALYDESIYRMAALQRLDAPMSVPARVRAILVIKENDIINLIKNSQSYTIRDDIKFMANKIPFMLDHPIVVTGSKYNGLIQDTVNTGTNAIARRDNYVYTIRYDISTKNSLDTDNTVYLQNKIVTLNGERLILITCFLRQVTMTEKSIAITKNSLVDVVTNDIAISGKLASFEVFYQENANSAEVQLEKILLGSDTPRTPFVQYMLRDNNTLRIHFPANIYFNPKWNSTIRVRLYTTLGADGNFDEYKGNLTCTFPSTNTPRQSTVIIDGQTIGASTGGVDIEEIEQFRTEVEYAYATNETICTDADLQRYFDKKMLNDTNKIVFFKKRDDVFQRLYGAFMLMKDTAGMVIPSNTLNIELNQGVDQTNSTIVNPNLVDTRTSTYEDVITQIEKCALDLPNFDNRITSVTQNKDTFLFSGVSTTDFIEIFLNSITRYYRIRDCYEDYVDIISIAGSGQGSVSMTVKHTGYSDFDDYYETSDRLILKPGAIFRYGEEGYKYMGLRDHNFSLATDMNNYEKISDAIRTAIRRLYMYSEDIIVSEIDGDHFEVTGVALDKFIADIIEYVQLNNKITIKHMEDYTQIEEEDGIIYADISYFLYTNPFIISIMRKPNAVMYYLNSVNTRLTFDYKTIADGAVSYIQFLLNSMKVTRNAIVGENFYAFEAVITPSTEETDFLDLACDYNDLDITKENDADGTILIRAKNSGYVSIIRYEEPFTIGTGDNRVDYRSGVYATVVYDDGTSEKIRVSSQNWSLGTSNYQFDVGYTMQYEVADTFNKNDILAIRKLKDKQLMRMMLIVNGEEFTENNGRFIPMVLEEYDQENNYYTFRGYVQASDMISTENTTILSHGVYDANGNEVDTKSANITMNNCTFDIVTFIKYADNNNPGEYGSNRYILGNYTFTNQYTMAETESFSFIEPIEFIRSTAIAEYDPFSDDPINETQKSYGKTTYTLNGVPLIKAQWVKNIENSQFLVSCILSNYREIRDVYTYLEENFSIDMKFFNTYGRSRFYQVGSGNDLEQRKDLDHVNCTLKFGIKLDTLSSEADFRKRFSAWVKNYIESVNEIENEGRSIYMMNLIADCKANFDEILYMEYYGFNDYDSSAQKIVSNFTTKIRDLGYNEYVPEFINIDTSNENYELVTSIEITMLEE